MEKLFDEKSVFSGSIFGGPNYFWEDVKLPAAQLSIEELFDRPKSLNKTEEDSEEKATEKFVELKARAKAAIIMSDKMRQLYEVLSNYPDVIRNKSYIERMLVERMVLVADDIKEIERECLGFTPRMLFKYHPGLSELHNALKNNYRYYLKEDIKLLPAALLPEEAMKRAGAENPRALAKTVIFGFNTSEELKRVFFVFEDIIKKHKYLERMLCEKMILLLASEGKLKEVLKEVPAIEEHPGLLELFKFCEWAEKAEKPGALDFDPFQCL